MAPNSNRVDFPIDNEVISSLTTQVGFLNYQEVDVELGEPNVLVRYADMLNNRLLGERGSLWHVTSEELVDYFMTLIYIRVARVNQEMSRVNSYDKFLVIPSFMLAYLKQVGIAHNDDFGVTLRPKMKSDFVPMQPVKMSEISNQLRVIKSLGIEYSDAMPGTFKGFWDFMSLQYVDGHIAGHNPDVHPGVALAASFVEMLQTEKVFNPLISYGTGTYFSRVVDRLA